MKLGPKKDDALFNRRLLSFVSVLFSLFWFVAVFVVDALRDEPFETEKVLAYLGVPSIITALILDKYLKAAKDLDKL